LNIKDGAQLDYYTLFTFVALGLSFLMIFIYRSVDIACGFTRAIMEMQGQESFQQFLNWIN
jgi:hypothetical protein